MTDCCEVERSVLTTINEDVMLCVIVSVLIVLIVKVVINTRVTVD